jgi:DNA-binding HxlR family transcriptional regulator
MKTTSKKDLRSHCAVNYGVEAFGDRWSLLIVRDIVIAGKKTYGQFLKSEEGIATNVLASRLTALEEQGILRKAPSPDDGRKDLYTLTEKGLDLIPIVLNIVLWSAKHDAGSYVHGIKDFVDRLQRDPVQVGEEVKALVRAGGCVFPRDENRQAT